jgi:hypothetical protein
LGNDGRHAHGGFLAPVLAKQSPAVLDSINQYSPVVIINGLAAIFVHDRLCAVRGWHDRDFDSDRPRGSRDKLSYPETQQNGPEHPQRRLRLTR